VISWLKTTNSVSSWRIYKRLGRVTIKARTN